MSFLVDFSSSQLHSKSKVCTNSTKVIKFSADKRTKKKREPAKQQTYKRQIDLDSIFIVIISVRITLKLYKILENPLYTVCPRTEITRGEKILFLNLRKNFRGLTFFASFETPISVIKKSFSTQRKT
jgi:hypothetical protein